MGLTVTRTYFEPQILASDPRKETARTSSQGLGFRVLATILPSEQLHFRAG